MDSSTKKTNPHFSNNYSTADFVWAASLGEGKSKAQLQFQAPTFRLLARHFPPFLRTQSKKRSSNKICFYYRRLWQCQIGLAQGQLGRQVCYQGDEEEGNHRQQARGPHRERKKDPRVIGAPFYRKYIHHSKLTLYC